MMVTNQYYSLPTGFPKMYISMLRFSCGKKINFLKNMFHVSINHLPSEQFRAISQNHQSLKKKYVDTVVASTEVSMKQHPVTTRNSSADKAIRTRDPLLFR